tara:strand:+ start:2428 stop:2607 length:180 start_codon:yes stop_codon:yes gene_type:complete
MKNVVGTLVPALILAIGGVLFNTVGDVAVLKKDTETIHSTLRDLKNGQSKIFNYLLEKK